MLFDFTTEQILRFNNIKRWNIIEMSATQTLPEHSYNVTMLSIMIYDEMHETRPDKYTKNDEFYSDLMQYSLAHDLPELFTGDIPTPLKKAMAGVMDNVENELFPKFSEYKDELEEKEPLIFTITKISDLIDAIQFARKFCIDTRKDAIVSEMEIKLSVVLNEHKDIKVAVQKIWTDARIFSKDTL